MTECMLMFMSIKVGGMIECMFMFLRSQIEGLFMK